MLRTTFLLLVGLLTTAQVSAQSDAADGRREFRAGVDAAEAGDWESARARFERAFELTERPIILLNLAAVHAELNDPRSAHQVLRRFLAEAPDSVREPQQANVESMMRELEAGAVRLTLVTSDESGELQLNGEPVSPGVELVNPNTPQTITLRVDGRVINEQTYTGAAGDEQTIRMDALVPTPREAATTVVRDEPPQEPPAGRSGLAIGLGITAAVLVIAAVVTLVLVLPSPEAPNGFEGNLGRIEI